MTPIEAVSMEDDVKIFHNAVREYIIWLLMFVLLYVSSYATICAFRRRSEKEDIYSADTEEDAVVYRISLWICTFSLAVSGGAVLLLPVSIVANEVLLVYPRSYYLQWVNSSLIHGLWNHIFLCSNLCLFVLLPFAYLFTESEGFPGSKKGIMPRVYETFVVLFLLSILVCGLAWVASALINNDQSSRQTLFDLWNFYLPYLYSCISLLGVLMLLICTPVGFARLFTVMGELVVKPKFLRDLDEELYTVQFEEQSIQRRIRQGNGINSIANGHVGTNELVKELEGVQREKIELEKRRLASSWRRNLGYPIVMLLLLALTVISVLMVSQNTVEILIGLKALPKGAHEIVLGISSLSALGPIGAALEVILILYFMSASIVGFYSLPYFHRAMPLIQDTPMTKIIANCMVMLVMSSALPVLSRTLGITNFDLLGNFGSMDWLGNFYIILSYNVIFAGATGLCLTTKFTYTIRQEIYNRLQNVFHRKDQKHSQSNGNNSVHIKED
jgi:hypothetical protein